LGLGANRSIAILNTPEKYPIEKDKLKRFTNLLMVLIVIWVSRSLFISLAPGALSLKLFMMLIMSEWEKSVGQFVLIV